MNISYEQYQGEHQLLPIIKLIEMDLSEPYCIYTYRYFTVNYPSLTFIAKIRNEEDPDKDEIIGCVIGKIDDRPNGTRRGYIGMLAVKKEHRKNGIASQLVKRVIDQMIAEFKVYEIVLETEVTNKGAINLYQKFGFIRDKLLQKYYLNGVDAFRLKLFTDHLKNHSSH